MHEKIEILPATCLATLPQLVQEFRDLSRLLSGIGWHYLLDYPWAATHLPPKRGITILDAGAGSGLMQWWLAERGVSVISVDRRSRANLPQKLRIRYRVVGLRSEDLERDPARLTVRSFLPSRSARRWKSYPCKLGAALDALFAYTSRRVPGKVYIYNQELKHMADIGSASVDAVVSISALEHNAPDDLKACVTELMRVLKPGGRLVATLAAARDDDWYHEPSNGWCYTEATIRDIFDLPPDCPSNYDCYDELFEALRGCDELRDNLADFYFESGDNGMPWGVWDPQYQPVGVVKVKPRV